MSRLASTTPATGRLNTPSPCSPILPRFASPYLARVKNLLTSAPADRRFPLARLMSSPMSSPLRKYSLASSRSPSLTRTCSSCSTGPGCRLARPRTSGLQPVSWLVVFAPCFTALSAFRPAHASVHSYEGQLSFGQRWALLSPPPGRCEIFPGLEEGGLLSPGSPRRERPETRRKLFADPGQGPSGVCQRRKRYQLCGSCLRTRMWWSVSISM